MISANQTQYSVDGINKKITVTRDFDAGVSQVWKAWTEKEYLDQWWAPKPYKAKTKRIDFREGGSWLYCMEGPDEEQQWCRADFTEIKSQQQYKGTDVFCDENGNKTNNLPAMEWDVRFMPETDGTRVVVVLTFASEEDMNKIIEMGFKEGFAAAHGNLDELLSQK